MTATFKVMISFDHSGDYHREKKMEISGISEMERDQRKENNILTTEVNFSRWMFEVLRHVS